MSAEIIPFPETVKVDLSDELQALTAANEMAMALMKCSPEQRVMALNFLGQVYCPGCGWSPLRHPGVPNCRMVTA
jgi:hypothetical protein